MSTVEIEPEDCFEVWEAAETRMWQLAVEGAHRVNQELGQEVIDVSTVYATFEPSANSRHLGCGCAASVSVA